METYELISFLVFIAFSTGMSYHFGQQRGYVEGMNEIVVDLMNDGYIDREGVFIPEPERKDKK